MNINVLEYLNILAVLIYDIFDGCRHEKGIFLIMGKLHSTVSVSGKVNIIKANIDERYKEIFCIIQELFQNADDAGSSKIILGWFDSLDDNLELTRGPGVFFINNGKLSQKDLKQIFEIGSSNKTTEQDKIGKFGLGMKSVFHICEAFFVMGHQPNSDFAANPVINEFFDPWDDKEETIPSRKIWHQDYEKFESEIYNSLNEKIKDLVAEWTQWLCLWLPLRTRDHSSESGALIEYYPKPNNNELFLPDNSLKMAKMLPFMKSVEEILFEGNISSNGRIKLVRDSCFTGNSNKDISGSIHVDGQGIIKYTGTEKIDLLPLYKELQNSSDWPKSVGTSDSGTSYQKDKAKPHVAATLLRRDLQSVNGKLQINHCVFLPLTDMVDNIFFDDFRADITINLHGCFFVDAGRRSFNIADPSGVNDTKIKWNRSIYRESLLPMLIPAIQKATVLWKDDEIGHVITAITRSKLYSDNENREAISTQYNFFNCLTRSGWKWQMIASTKEYVYLPKSANETIQSHICKFLSDKFVLVHSDSPALARKDQEKSWSDEMIKVVRNAIYSLDENIKYSSQTVIFLIDFVKIVRRNDENCELTKLIKGYLCGINFRDYQINIHNIGNLVQPLPSCYRQIEVADTNWNSNSFESWKTVAVKSKDVMPLVLRGDFATKAKYSRVDTVEMLRTISNLTVNCSDAQWALLKKIVCDIVANSEFHISESDISGLKLFRLENLFFSYTEIVEMHNQGNVCIPGGSGQGIIRDLKRAAKVEIYTIDKDYNDCLGLDFRIFDLELCKKILASCPDLHPPKDRLDIFNRLKIDENYFHAVRYILHGDKKMYYDEQDLLVPSLDDVVTSELKFWQDLLSTLLMYRNMTPISIPRDLSNSLSRTEEEKFKVKPLRCDDLIKMLAGHQLEQRDFGWCDNNGWKSLIKNINIDDESVREAVKHIPIFYTIDGQLTKLDEKCFLEDEIEIPKLFLADVKRISFDIDPAVSQIQSKLLADKIWNQNTTLEFCINDPKHEEIPELILEAIEDLASENKMITEHLAIALKDIAFIRTSSGTVVKPKDILSIEQIDFGSNSAEDYGLFYLEQIDGTILISNGWNLIKGILPNKEDIVKNISSMLADVECYYIGKWENYDCDVDTILSIFFEPNVMPVIDVLKSLHRQNINCETLIRTLKLSISPARIILVCNYLAKEAHDRIDRKIKEIYKVFLAESTDYPVFREAILPELLFLTENNLLKSSSGICHNAESVAPEFILNHEYRNIIPAALRDNGLRRDTQLPDFENSRNITVAELIQKSDTTWSNLENYFRYWDDSLDAQIGGFILLCDDTDMVKNRVRNRYLPNRNEEILRYQVSQYLPDNMRSTKLIIDIMAEEYIAVTSLLGRELMVSFSKLNEINNLLVGELWYACYLGFAENEKYLYLALRPISQGDLHLISKERLSQLLKNTVDEILEKIYPNSLSGFNTDDLWKELGQSEQLDLLTTQTLIMEHTAIYLPMLGLRHDGEIKQVLNDWREARYDRVEAYKHDNVEQLNRATSEIQRLQDELRNLIENREEIRTEILSAIRHRISEHYGYSINSIPFEIFQNADDAVVEYQNMKSQGGSKKYKFVINYDEKDLTFIHWGRQINQFSVSGFSRGIELGYRCDLEKMLLLLQSDKDDCGEVKLTGKFGLGFKSVFLITDRPLISSGRLNFSIEGGILPFQLCAKEHDKVNALLNLAQRCFDVEDYSQYPKPTIINLPLRQNVSCKESIEKFIEFAPFLTSFSHCIGEIEIRTCQHMYRINASDESNSNKMAVIGYKKDASTAYYAIFKTQTGSIVVGYDQQNKFYPLPENVPTIWTTVPTGEKLNLGFIVNASFELDIGRNHLNNATEKNIEIAKSIGNELGKVLLEEAQSHKEYTWFESLWKTFSNGLDSGRWTAINTNQAGPILKAIIWGSREAPSGYGYLLKEFSAIPSGLAGNYRKLCKLNDIKYVINDALSHPSIWNSFSKIGEKIEYLAPGEVIADASTGKALKAIYHISDRELAVLTPGKLIEQLSREDKYISPEFLNSLHGIQDSIKLLKDKYMEDYNELSDALNLLLFQAKDGSKQTAGKLLLLNNKDNPDESKRATFAPDSAILSEEYSECVQAFFCLSRGEMQADSVRLKQWVLDADTIDKQQAVLQYLAYGELNSKLGELLTQDVIKGTYLHAINWDNYYFDPNSRHIITGILKLGQNYDFPVDDKIDFFPPTAVLNPQASLEELHSRWMDEKPELLRKYNLKVYGLENISALSFSLNTLDDRSRWMELLVLGAAHTLGRTNLEQHRGFIDFCRNRSYWETFCTPKINAESWLDIIDDFMAMDGDMGKFNYWMQLYTSIYQFSKHLDDYVQVFYWWNSKQAARNINDLRRFRSNDLYAGTGMEPPSLEKKLGRVGFHFVMRELIRSKTIDNDDLHRFCFIPTSSNCDYMKEISFHGFKESEEIYDFIFEYLKEKTTFDLAFDIAFQK